VPFLLATVVGKRLLLLLLLLLLRLLLPLLPGLRVFVSEEDSTINIAGYSITSPFWDE